jgi:hypothetical protein
LVIGLNIQIQTKALNKGIFKIKTEKDLKTNFESFRKAKPT